MVVGDIFTMIHLRLSLQVTTFLGMTSLLAGCFSTSLEWISPEEMLRRQEDALRFKFSCDPSARPSGNFLKRLTREELLATLHRTINDYLGSEASAVLTSIQSEESLLPGDSAAAIQLFRSSNKNMTDLADPLTRLAIKLADQVTASSSRISLFFGSCANSSPLSSTCFQQSVVNRVARRFFRRPPSTEEVQRIQALYNSDASNGLRNLMIYFALSPAFVFHDYLGGTEIEHKILQMTPYERVSRASFFFLGEGPDDGLLERVRLGQVTNDSQYATLVSSLFNSSPYQTRLRSHFLSFFRQWLRYEDKAVASGRLQDPKYQATFNGLQVDQNFVNAAKTELDQLFTYHVFYRPGSSFEDLFSSRTVLTQNATLANAYGVSPWNGNYTGTLPTVAETRGFLARTAVLYHGNENRHFFPDGHHLRRDILCTPLSPPPAAAAGIDPPEATGLESTREASENLTSSNSCIGCHSQMAMSFASNNFDAIGRFRTTEDIYDHTGRFIASVGLDSQVTPRIHPKDRATYEGMDGLFAAVRKTDQHEACFVRQLYRDAFWKLEDLRLEGCSLRTWMDTLKTQGILETYKGIALDPRFSRYIAD